MSGFPFASHRTPTTNIPSGEMLGAPTETSDDNVPTSFPDRSTQVIRFGQRNHAPYDSIGERVAFDQFENE